MPKSPLENFHTHTCYCRHAEGFVQDYARAALAAGAAAIGFSDHVPVQNPQLHGVFRMALSEAPTYIAEIQKAKRLYKGQLKIYLGWEADLDGAEEELFFAQKIAPLSPPDFIIGSVHNIAQGGKAANIFNLESRSELEAYTRLIADAMQSRKYTFIGHPDRVFLGAAMRRQSARLQPVWQEIIDCAHETGAVLEFNASSFLTEAGPLPLFWRQAAKASLKAAVTSDAHSPQALFQNRQKASLFLREMGVQEIFFSDIFKEKSL